MKTPSAEKTYSLAELFARDPRQLSDDDFRALIHELREARSKFVLGTGKKTGSAKLTPAQTDAVRLDLDIKL